MFNWHTEYTAEFTRNQIKDEMQKIRLEEQALSLRPYRPNWYGRLMFGLGNWMVATGKNIRQRHEIPSMNCHNSPHGSFAR